MAAIDLLTLLAPSTGSFDSCIGSTASGRISPLDASWALSSVSSPLGRRLIRAKYLAQDQATLYKEWVQFVEAFAVNKNWKPRAKNQDLIMRLACCAMSESLNPFTKMTMRQRSILLGFKSPQSYTETWHARFTELVEMLNDIERRSIEEFSRKISSKR